MRKLAAVSVLVCILLSLNSCSWKRMTYLQDLETLTTYDVTEAPDVKIRKNDNTMYGLLETEIASISVVN